MAVAALITWIVTALGGFYLLATWLQKGGLRQQGGGPTRFPSALVFGHFLAAAAGLVLWLVYTVSDSTATAWLGLVVIVLTAVGGFTLFARWLPARRSVGAAAGGATRASAAGGEIAAEQHFPTMAVLGHGAIAAVTVVLVLIAALTA